MDIAEQLRNEFTQFMDKEGIKYEVINEDDNIVRLAFAGRESKGGGVDTTIFVDFDEGSSTNSVHFVAQRFASCKLENYPQVLVKLNDANRRYRWVKFWANQDGDTAYLSADTDAMLVPGASALECVRMSFRMSDIVEDVIMDLGELVEPDDGKEHLRAMLAALKEMLGED